MVGAAALCAEGLGLVGGGVEAEGDAGSGLAEEADGGGSDAARAASDEGGASGEGEGDAGSWERRHEVTLPKKFPGMQMAGEYSRHPGHLSRMAALLGG
jgi:hypothetical protein